MSALKHRETEHSRDRQQQMLLAIATFTRQHGYAPTVRDIRSGLNLSSTSVAVARLDRLEAHGWITRTPNVARSIRLKKGPKVTA